MSILCYVPFMGFVASVIILGTRRYRNDRVIRFHAFQGLYIFAAWLVVNWAIAPVFAAIPHDVFRVDKLLQVLILVVWVFMMVKTSHGETYALPLIGELAQRSAHERT